MTNIKNRIRTIKTELEQLEEQKEQFKNKITELENRIAQEDKIDFCQWIGRNGDTLTIKGDKYVISYVDGDILYSDRYNDVFNDNVSYKEGELKDLKYGNIFIFKEKLYDIELYNFGMFIGKDEDGDYIVQYLGKDNGIEIIKYSTYYKEYEDRNIIIFNRF